MSTIQSTPKRASASEATNLPSPVPELASVYRVREPGEDAEKFQKLDRNERLQALPEWFMREITSRLRSETLTYYPVTDALYRQLSATLGLKEENILLTPGSDGAFRSLFQAYVRPGDTVVMLDPSYAMYEVYAQMFQAKAVKIGFNQNREVDTDKLLTSVQKGVRLVFIANPNQPTGTVLSEQVMRALLERATDAGALLVVDEAYYPFSHTTVLPWVRDHANLAVTRSFSKAFGLAGLRIGFIAGHKDVIANVFKVRSAHDVNGFAALCAEVAVANPRLADEFVADAEAGARALEARALKMGLTPILCPANFMLIKVGHVCPPGKLVEALQRRGYLVKGPFRAPSIADCIRVTLGPTSLMTQFADVLEATLKEVR